MSVENSVTSNGKQVEVHYRRSFLARYIQSDDELQGYYTAVKNELLSYARVRSRTSWKCETYKQARVMLAHINVMGKYLHLYLAMSPTEYDGKNCVSDAGDRYEDTPLLVRVNSERSLKRAFELIAMMMEKKGIARVERESEDYKVPYESTQALLERGLIKMILPTGVTLGEQDALVEMDILTLVGKADGASAQEVAEPAQEPVVQTPAAPLYAVGDVVALTKIDFANAEITHKVNGAMVEKLGLVLEAVVVKAEQRDAAVHYYLELQTMSKIKRKRCRARAKNLIFTDIKAPGGLAVPYTATEFYILPSKQQKEVLQDAERVWEYRRTCEQLALLNGLKSPDKKMAEMCKQWQARYKAQVAALPKAEIWQSLINA